MQSNTITWPAYGSCRMPPKSGRSVFLVSGCLNKFFWPSGITDGSPTQLHQKRSFNYEFPAHWTIPSVRNRHATALILPQSTTAYRDDRPASHQQLREKAFVVLACSSLKRFRRILSCSSLALGSDFVKASATNVSPDSRLSAMACSAT